MAALQVGKSIKESQKVNETQNEIRSQGNCQYFAGNIAEQRELPRNGVETSEISLALKQYIFQMSLKYRFNRKFGHFRPSLLTTPPNLVLFYV